MLSGERPLSERIGDMLAPDSLSELKALERIALSRTVNIAANGKSPKHWSMDRWIAVTSAIGTVIMATIVAVFAAGGEWQALKSGLSQLRMSFDQFRGYVSVEFEEVHRRIDANDAADQDSRGGPPPSSRRSKTPAFPRDERFVSGRGGGGGQ